MKKAISEWCCAITLATASIASASPFSVTYTDTISNFTGSFTDINVGETAQVTLVFDNGGSSAANQTWTAANVQCVIFKFNNAGNRFAAINYAGSSVPTTTGTFTTNGAGQLQAGTIDWEDQSDPVTAPSVVNIAGVTGGVGNWLLNGANRVVDFSVGAISFTNVANDTQVTNWSNPTPAGGVCASFFGGRPPPNSAAPVPTLNPWGMIALSALTGVAAVVGLRRRRG
jgi:hypothetical protein